MLFVLEKELNRLGEHRNSWIKQLEEQNENQRSFRPETGKWSSTEVVQHLFLVEKEVIGYIEKKSNNPEALKKKGCKSTISLALLKFALRLPIRIKVPIEQVKPKTDISWEKVRSEWNECHKNWQALLDKVTEDQLGRLWFRHPVAGSLTLQQTFQFLIEHMEHHLQQLKRIQNHPQFPKDISA